MIYAKLTQDGDYAGQVDLTPEEYADLEANGKSVWLRVWQDVSAPAVGPLQSVEIGPVVIGETDAHLSWIVRDKTPEELEAEALIAQMDELRALLGSLAGSVEAPDTAGTVEQRLAKLEARIARLENIGLWALRKIT